MGFDYKNLISRLRDGNFLKYTSIALAIVFLYLLFSKVVVGALLLVAAVFSAWMVKVLGIRNFGFELTTLVTVIFGMAFGPKIGGLIGFFLIIFQLIIGQYLSTYILWVVPGYVAAGVVAGLIGGMNVAGAGFMITVGLNVFFVLCTALFTPPQLPKYLPYAGLNVAINFFLFKFIAPQIMSVMI